MFSVSSAALVLFLRTNYISDEESLFVDVLMGGADPVTLKREARIALVSGVLYGFAVTHWLV